MSKMSHIVKIPQRKIHNTEKRQHFYRALLLNTDIGSNTMRDLTVKYLKEKRVTLKQHLTELRVRQKINQYKQLSSEQMHTINASCPSLDKMDISLLTVILLHTFPEQLSTDARKCIADLKNIRNKLAHVVQAELDDDSIFKDTCKEILNLAKEVGLSKSDSQHLFQTINEVRHQEVVYNYCNLERIKLNNEMYVVKLVESNENEGDSLFYVKADDASVWGIKVGLTKWVRHLSRGLNVETFLQTLKDEGVISDTVKRKIEEEYSNEGQMQALVLYMMDETKHNLYTFCHCLRQVSALMADLVEGSNTDGREVEEYLKSCERERITGLLKQHLTQEVDKSVATESLHIFIEEHFGVTMAFSVLKTYVHETFPAVKHTSEDFSFMGLSWKEENTEQEGDEEESLEQAQITHMTCESFSTYVSEWFANEGLAIPLKKAIYDESISPKIFIEMTKDEMRTVFSPYIENAENTSGNKHKYGFGVEKGLGLIQRKIVGENTSVIAESESIELLRPFDAPFPRTKYKQCQVRPSEGHLLIPAHEFRFHSTAKRNTKHYVVKEVIRFVAACINGRKNGTIHFGIEPLGNSMGHINGIPSENWQYGLNIEIGKAIDVCFKENACIAFKCIRPIYRIPVEGGGIVMEVDVVPFSVYLAANLLKIAFPPKGNQIEHCYVYCLKPEGGILPVSDPKLKDVEEFYEKALYERRKLEEYNDRRIDRSSLLVKQLRKMLTGGQTYVTDAFVPIIVSGKITGSSNEFEVREQIEDMSRAFGSSVLVLDCDHTVRLRKHIEGGKRIFNVKMAEDLITNNELSKTSSTWLYVNGNNELSKEAMPIENWMENRAEGVKKALEKVKESIPQSRAKVIFLVYRSSKADKVLLREIARMTFIDNFKNQCLVIAEEEEDVLDLKKELSSFGHQRLENSFHTGLSWKSLSRLMKNVFNFNPSVVCKLPHCDGHYVEMTALEREELNFTDIDILSGEECIDREALMNDEKRRSNAKSSQENFYHGSPVSWWNLYYQQVGERDLYMNHRIEIRDKLLKDDCATLTELHEIDHHPGAGGSTLGRHLLWYFSQFRKTPEKAYRCCVVKTSNITDITIEQIEKFRNFNDGECPKPFVVLADNKNEECENDLKAKLHELAYKTAYPGKLFCLIILINRKPITYEEADSKPLLRHALSWKEQIWFEEKYKQMENSEDVDVETLIAFNCMRHSFHRDYMQRTIDHLMEGVSKKEIDVLSCLSLIKSYESDCHVPESVFDSMMDALPIDIGQPWGIAHSVPELHRLAMLRREPWNTEISRAMDLLLIKKKGSDFYSSGVSVVSQLLAKTVLQYIQRKQNVSLESMVAHTLDIVQRKANESNPMSKRFVKIVCSLFKTRQLLEGEGMELKQKFSDLVLELNVQDTEESEMDANGRVLRTMIRCFDVTKDPLVGQQLARFNIHIKEYEAAEEAIKQSLQIQRQNSYLLHTYGQVFKTKMENMLYVASQTKTKIRDAEGAEIIELAYIAIDKFVVGQRVAISAGENTTWGCFFTEIKTALILLEKFQLFACFTDRKTFISFLNDDINSVADGPLLRMLRRCEVLKNFRAGSNAQYHLETSLRSLEERNYQIKRKLYVIYSEDDTLLLGLRERFERFYGSLKSTDKYQFSFGIGLKPLMVAKERKEMTLNRRVKEAKEHLQGSDRTKVDVRDLLVYLGVKIITISRQEVDQDNGVCSIEEYKRLLSYSTNLVALQTAEPASRRLYLETFLYYAMLHWPLKSRTGLNLDILARPAPYEQIMKRWAEAYNQNFYITTREQHQRYRPKNFFALGKGSPGNEIVDLKSIEREWMDRKKRTTGRVRRPVFKDFFWREDFVEERLERLEGVMDESGNNVTHEAEYFEGFHQFRLRTYYPCPDLSNRSVTFVLGFTWKEPTAFDVRESGKGNRSTDKKAGLSEKNVGNEISGQTEELTETTLYERTSQCDAQSDTTGRPKSRRRRKKKK